MKNKKTKNLMVLLAAPLPGFTSVEITNPSAISFRVIQERRTLGIFNGANQIGGLSISYLKTATGIVCYFDATHFYYKIQDIPTSKCTTMIAGCLDFHVARADGYGSGSEFAIKGYDDNRATSVNPKPCVSKSVKATESYPAYVLYFDYNLQGDKTSLYDTICLGN